MRSIAGKRISAVLGTLLCLGLLLPAGVFGQQQPGGQEVQVNVLKAFPGATGEDLDVSPSSSPFNLNAIGDEAAAGVRSAGVNKWCIQNITAFASRFNIGCGNGMETHANGFELPPWFDTGMVWGAPASDMPEEVNRDALKGLGYTVNMTTLIIGGFVSGGGDKLWASDRSAAELLNLGVTGTDDGSCTDHTADFAGEMSTGSQLTPTSDCPATHPASGFGGRHPIEGEAFLELQASHPDFAPSVDNDPFAFWRVPEEMQQTDQFFGDWATYGELTDSWLEALGRYGGVIPGGSGDPIYGGWPLGLTMFYDAFYFQLPTVANTQYMQSTIVNNSERVYGVGVEYDSVYIGINYDPLQCESQGGTCPQSDAHFFDPDRNLVTFYDGGNCPNAAPSPSTCPGYGFENGSVPMGFVILKSPIGDMRYELFSDPGSDFYDPSHPRAGDTITIQHQHNCGFGGCIPNTWSRSLRAHFGLLSSTGENVLDGRTPGDLDDADYWLVFRSEKWPERNGQFNKYVPGVDDDQPVWDWNHDGVPDTIYSDACGSTDPDAGLIGGCVDLWSDTLPGGHANRYGNISEMAVGPVHMAPNDTVGFVVGVLADVDSAGMERTIDNAIDFYKNFYLGPSSATPPRIGGAGGAGGGISVVPGEQGQAQVQLFFDDAAEQFRDPFFEKLIQSLTPQQLQHNPWLPDSIRARQENNLAAIHIFKSCDGGSSFTSNSGDCDGDPISDATSKWAGFGWQPYATIQAGADGTVPNTYTDTNVQPGVTVTYTIVTETRGMNFDIVTEVDGELRGQRVEFAPALLSGLTTSSTSPNVAVVYVPLNLAAGARLADSRFVSRTGSSTVPVNVEVVRTAPSGGQYRAVFADSIEVTQVETLNADGEVESINTSVRGMETVTVTNAEGEDEARVIDSFDFDKSGTVALGAIPQVSVEESGNERRTVFASGDFGLIAASGNTPLMASTGLDGANTTPGTFFGQQDFPFFVLQVDEGVGGDFNAQTWVSEGGDTIPGRTAPSVRWLTSGSQSSSALDPSEFGTFQFSWSDAPFPGAPYNIQTQGVEDAVSTALAGRASVSTTSTDPEILAAVKEADPSVTTAEGDLQALSLPFSVRNTTYDRDVTLIATRHQDDILIGTGIDTLRVEVPDGVWVPGDVLYAIETITRNVTDDNGNVVLGADGQPQTETVPAATFQVAMACGVPRPSCDPTVGTADPTGYSILRPGTQQFVDYFVPLKAGDEYVFEVRPAVSAAQAAAQGDVSLDGVHVVPNPYLYTSKFERSTGDRVLRFTSLPPEGRIRIYDVAGRFIQQIEYVPEDLRGGDLDWDMTTRENLELAAGLYIFALETPEGDRKLGKFVVIR